MATVPFGINFFSSVRLEQKSGEQYFDEALRLSELADELGYSHVRTVEHYFRPYGGMTPSPIVFLTAVAARTRRVRLITGAVIPIFNHPIKIAGETAMLMVVPCVSRFDTMQDNLCRYRETFAAAHPERPVPRVQMSFHLHVAETDVRAVAESTEPMEQYVRVFRESASAWDGRSSAAYPGYEQLVGELDSMTMERVLREQRAFIGNPDTVERQIRHFLGLFGDVEPSLSMLYGNMPYQTAERSLRLFATEVMPRFAATTSSSPLAVGGRRPAFGER